MRPRVEGQCIDGADYSLRDRGSNSLASHPMGSIGYFSVRDRRILLIHGYNVKELSGQDSMAQLRHALIEGCPSLAREIFTVTWPGNEPWIKGGPAAYFAKVRVAQEAGRLFYEGLLAEFRNRMGPRKLVIIAHSLGCRLTLEFLKHLDKSSRPRRLKKVTAILMAPAVPTELNELVAAAKDNADQIIVLHSTEDKVLKRWFRLGQTVALEGRFPEAIGYAGNPHTPPWSFEKRMTGYDHGDYWTNQSTSDVIGQQLSRLYADITYRPRGGRDTSKLDRSMLNEATYLPEYSLPQF